MALTLAGCGPAATTESPPTASSPTLSESWDASVPGSTGRQAARQAAWAYEGPTLSLDAASAFSTRTAGSGADLVDEIMRHVGLPPNFDVISHPDVPNAAALIASDPNGVPRRLIAYNPAFLTRAAALSAEHRWAPISVFAHEVGHHLSGHTIHAGGGRHALELEADRFAGFVLFKMGARLDQAQSAVRALVPVAASATHPGRTERLNAVAAGWSDACRQTRSDCDGGGSDPVASAPAAVEPRTNPLAPDAGPPDARPDSVANDAVAPAARYDRLPAADPAAIPLKTTRFVWDELGLLDPETRAAHERAMFAHAARHGVEIVLLVVADLDGVGADEYARAMARQLRIGKLDVGNGAVLVVAPRQGTTAVFLGPGLAIDMRHHDIGARLERWLVAHRSGCITAGRCSAAETELLLGAAEHLARDSGHVTWQIRFGDFPALIEGLRAEAGDPLAYDPATSAIHRALVRFDARVVEIDPDPDRNDIAIHANEIKSGRRAALVDLGDGWRGMVYLDPATAELMPAGALVAGAAYSMVGRVDSLSDNPRDTQSFDLLSWHLIEAAP